MQILISVASNQEFSLKQRLAIEVSKNQWSFATVTGIRRKYIDVKYDDGYIGEFDKVGDIKSVKFLPKTVKRNKEHLTKAQLMEFIKSLTAVEEAPAKKPVQQVARKKAPVVEQVVRKTRQVLEMDGTIEPSAEPKSKRITVTMKEQKAKPVATIKNILKSSKDKPIRPIDLSRGMVVQVPVDGTLLPVLLLTNTGKSWSVVNLHENGKIIQVPDNQMFTHNAQLSKYEKLWVGKYMRRLEELES